MSGSLESMVSGALAGLWFGPGGCIRSSMRQVLTMHAGCMQGGGVETLRAIPWIFAWTQVRMVLPAWLGIDTALRRLFEDVSAPSPSCCVTPAMRCWLLNYKEKDVQIVPAGGQSFQSTTDLSC